MKVLLFPLVLLTLSSCTTVSEHGQKVFSTSSNMEGMEFRSAGGSILRASRIDNSSVHAAVGNSIGKAAAGVGAGLISSGLR